MITKTPRCGCRFYGNQHGSWFRACEEHAEIWRFIARSRHQSVEKAFNQVVHSYARRVLRTAS